MIWFITVAFSKWNSRLLRCVLWFYPFSFVLSAFLTCFFLSAWCDIYRKIKHQFSTADAFYWQYTETKSSMLKNKKRFFWNEVDAHFNDTSKHIRNYIIDYNNCLLKEEKTGISHLLLSAFFFFFLRSVCVRQKRKKNRLFSAGQYQYYKKKQYWSSWWMRNRPDTLLLLL